MTDSKRFPMVLTVLFGIFVLLSTVLFLNKLSLEKQNRRWTDLSHRLEQMLDRSKQHRHRLFHSMQSRQKEAKNLGTSLEAIKKEKQSLESSIKENEANIASIQQEKTYLEEMLIHKTKEIEVLSARTGQSSSDAGVGTVNEEELKRLNDQNQILRDKLARLYKAVSSNINEINVAKIALEETVSSAKKKIDDEWNTVNLGSVTTGETSDEIPTPGTNKEPKTEGHVLAVNDEHGFVVIDLGSADNLPTNATLQVKKNGQTIATLSVLEIRNAMAACNIKDLRDGQRIEINDLVSIIR